MTLGTASLDFNQTTATVTDNGFNFMKAFRVFNVEIPDDDEDEEEEELQFELLPALDNTPEISIHLSDHKRCASHTISLVGTTDAIRLLKHLHHFPSSLIRQWANARHCGLAQGGPSRLRLFKQFLGVG